MMKAPGRPLGSGAFVMSGEPQAASRKQPQAGLGRADGMGVMLPYMPRAGPVGAGSVGTLARQRDRAVSLGVRRGWNR